MTACSKYAQVDDMFDDVDFYTAPPFPTGELKTEILENSDDEGEDLHDEGQLRRDYMPVPELDRYDGEDLDADEYSPMSPAR